MKISLGIGSKREVGGIMVFMMMIMVIMMMMVVDGREVVDGIIKGRNAEPYLTNHTTPYSIPHQPYHIIPHTAPTIPHLIAHSLTAAHYCSFGGDLN